MTGGNQAPVVVRLNGPRLLLLALAVLLLLVLAAWAGYRLGRDLGRVDRPTPASSRLPDAPMEEGVVGEAGGFDSPVDLRSGWALLVFRSASMQEAEGVRAELAGRGLPVRLDQDPRRPAPERFRVLVGPFPRREDAQRAGEELETGPDGALEVVRVE